MSSPHPAALRTRAEQLAREGHPAKEVARRLGVSPQTVYRWRRSRASGSDLAQARTRIGELEHEVLLCRELIATLRQMMPPKRRYEVIHHMASQGFPARRIAVLLNVSESGYYAWRARTPSPRALRRAWLTRLILDIHQESRSAYGYRRVRQELGHRYGIDVSHATVEVIMKGAGIRGRAGRLHERAPQDSARTPSRRWTVDVLAFTTLQGPLYTAVVLDTASRCPIGWSTATAADRTLVHHALMAAITRAAHAEPAAGTAYESLLACSFTERAGVLECAPGGGRAADRYDHAVVAVFWDTVHRELHGPSSWPDTHSLEDRLRETFHRFARQA